MPSTTRPSISSPAAIRAAASKFREALALDPDLLDAMHGLIRTLQDAGDYDQAITVAHELIIRNPDDPLAHTSLSILYQRKGMVPEAEAEALKAKLLGWKLELRESQISADEERESKPSALSPNPPPRLRENV